jgi:putative ABC transport system permease protein
MIVLDTLRMAAGEFVSNKMRTALTMLGIIIGVSAVIALMAAGQGTQQGITQEVRGLGTNLLFVGPAQSSSGGGVNDRFNLTLTSTDVDALNDTSQFPYLDGAVGFFGNDPASDTDTEQRGVANGRNTTIYLAATEPAYEGIRNVRLQAGSFLTDEDLRRKTTSAVIGAQVAEDLFGTAGDAMGQTVRIGFERFSMNLRVIGVMERRGGSGQDDRTVILPLSTFQARIPFARSATGEKTVRQIIVKVGESGDLNRAKSEITSALIALRDGNQDFVVESQDDLLSTSRKVTRTLTILLGAIAGISLVVGGIGIMNILLVSVTERTREIGIRKAVGANMDHILLQFVVEAVVVTFAGGMVGVVLGVGAAMIANGQDFGTGTTVNTVVTPLSVFVAFAVSVVIGLFFGIYPAWRASRLDPIEALRSD